jgi:hypothetical protein
MHKQLRGCAFLGRMCVLDVALPVDGGKAASCFDDGYQHLGALRFYSNGVGLIKDCMFIGPVSVGHNDIVRTNSTTVTFECSDGFGGRPVQMQGNQISVIPPKDLNCTATYKCEVTPTRNECIAVPDGSGPFSALRACQQRCLRSPN